MSHRYTHHYEVNNGGPAMARSIIIDGAEEVACPKCAHGFPLTEGISRQTIERYAEDFERAFAERREALEKQLDAEARRRAEREVGGQLAQLKEQLGAAKGQLDKAREDARNAAKEQFETELRSLREALSAKDGALDKSRTEELALRRQVMALEDARKAQELEYQRRLDDERKRIESQARTAAGEDLARREAQWKAQLESAQREAADLKRKLEQGSQQLQGEALELSLESLLMSAFPMDEIVPVPKGMNGADLLQRVRSPSGQVAGTIIWEAKQTKAWQPAWLQKLKDDQQACGAELAVIVTAAMPKEAREPFVRESDVWVARFDAARPLAQALRSTLLELHKLRLANQGRSEKMELVYNYICSAQFAQRVKAVVDGFEAMRQDLEAEKNAMTRIWKKREGQLTRMTGSLLGVVGDLQGIGEDSLPQLHNIAALPLPFEDDPVSTP
jgi:hypothetical protein